MFLMNDYYVLGDKKAFKTKDEFITEVFAVFEIIVNKKDVDEVWMRFSPLVEGGSYVATKPNVQGSFPCWEYQYN